MQLRIWILFLLSVGGRVVTAVEKVDDSTPVMSLEELIEAPVIVSAKDSQRLFDSPANAYVFDEEAIDFLPVDSIPELLRYAPGVHVMKVGNGSWGVGIRGMNSQALGRVPFTIDDQDMNASIFSGLYGSQPFLIFEDMASVEVIYGPGGVHWHNNGGNGAVNVVMKTAFETLGSFGEVHLGTESREVEGRVGWSLDEQSAMRVYGTYMNREDSGEVEDLDDRREVGRIGTRYDLRWTPDDLLSITADLHGSRSGTVSAEPRSEDDLRAAFAERRGSELSFYEADLQAKWIRQFGDDEAFSLRSWTSFSSLEAYFASYDLLTVGLESELRLRTESEDEWIVSARLNGTFLDLHESFSTRYTETSPSDSLSEMGVQWTRPLVDDRLDLTLSLTGQYETMGENFELTPSIRFLYKPTEEDRLWISYTRSARPLNSSSTYAALGYGPFYDSPPTVLPGPIVVDRTQVTVVRNESIENEKIESFELGYRRDLAEHGELGLTLFYNRYNDLLGYNYAGMELRNIMDPGATPYWDLMIKPDNIADATTMGLNAHIHWEFNPRVSATLTYSYLDDSYEATWTPVDPGSPVEAAVNEDYFNRLEDSNPRHMASLWIAGELTEALRADLGFRYSDAFGQDGGADQSAIFQMDARLTWQYSDALEFSLVGRNLLDETTDESGLMNFYGVSSEVKREFYLEATYRF